MRTRFLCLLFLLAACSSTKVGVDRDPTYDFAGKDTYAWQAGVPAASELQEKRIKAAVDDELAQRGLRESAGGTPDLWVRTEAGGRSEVRSSGTGVGFGVGHGTSFGGVGVGASTGDRVREVQVGTLVISVLDGPTEEVVWRAEALDLATSDPERHASALKKAIEEAFERFPISAQGG